jgi:hypothetical protein
MLAGFRNQQRGNSSRDAYFNTRRKYLNGKPVRRSGIVRALAISGISAMSSRQHGQSSPLSHLRCCSAEKPADTTGHFMGVFQKL